jgi:hypothetical protein
MQVSGQLHASAVLLPRNHDPLRRSGRCGEEKKSCHTGNRTRVIHPRFTDGAVATQYNIKMNVGSVEYEDMNLVLLSYWITGYYRGDYECDSV